MTTAVATTPAPASSMPIFATGLPIIGTIDFNQPLEWAAWGGIAVTMFVVQNGLTKWLIIGGIIAARYEFMVKGKS